MNSLIHFEDLKADASTKPASSAATSDAGFQPLIEQLRRRLVNGNCADSMDVRIAIVGELVYCCYRELMTRRYL
jgi:hypothetical protein